MNFQEAVLSAVIPRGSADKADADQAFREVLRNKVTVRQFTGAYKTLFEIVGLQAQRTSPLDMELLSAYLESSALGDEQKSEVKLLFSACKNQVTAPDKLETMCKALIDEQNLVNFSQALITTGEILSQGKRVGKQELKGLAAAKKYLVDCVTLMQSSEDSSYPSETLVESVPVFWDDYFRKANNPGSGLLTGIAEIDGLTNGYDPGEFIVLGAAYGEGKSTLLRNFSYNAVFRHKKNIVYFTLEMPHKQIMRELVSLHSLDRKFKNPEGIPSNRIQKADLNDREKSQLKAVTDDIENNVDYGIYKIIQLPNNATVSTIRESLMYLNNQFPLHGVYIDYASLLTSEVNRNSTISETADTLKKLKNLATTFNSGAGIPIITAHQISREARMRVDKGEEKRYDRSFLSDTSEAEKSADMIFWCLRTEDMERAHELKMGVAKNRRGPKIPDWPIRENFQCGQVSSIHTPSALNKDAIYDL
jgi:replicative DNA helicase